VLERYLQARRAEAVGLDPAGAEPIDEIARLVRAGGKRLRPAFCYWGYRAAGGGDTDTIWSVAALFLILFAYAALGPVGRAPFTGDQGNKPAPSQSTPATGRGRRAVGAAGTAVVPVAHAPAAPKPSATPTPSPSTSPAASAPPSPSASSQPPGAPSGPPPAATPTVPPTPSPSPSSEPAAPTTTVPPPPPPATDPPQAPIVLCDPVVTVNCG